MIKRYADSIYLMVKAQLDNYYSLAQAVYGLSKNDYIKIIKEIIRMYERDA